MGTISKRSKRKRFFEKEDATIPTPDKTMTLILKELNPLPHPYQDDIDNEWIPTESN